jgi:hypothetical protein
VQKPRSGVSLFPELQGILDEISKQWASMPTEDKAFLVGRILGQIILEFATMLASGGSIQALRAGGCARFINALKSLGFSDDAARQFIKLIDKILIKLDTGCFVAGTLVSVNVPADSKFYDTPDQKDSFGEEPTQTAVATISARAIQVPIEEVPLGSITSY